MPWIGPGRMIATSTTRSSSVDGRDFGSVCIWARLSTWKTPTVSAAWSIAKTSGTSSGRRSRSRQTAQSCSISWSVSSIAASIPSPSRSSLISLRASTSRLSNWTTTRSGIVARSSGAMSISGAAVTSIPPLWMLRDGAGSRRSGRRTRASAPSRERSFVEPPRAWRRRLGLDARRPTSGRRPGPCGAVSAPAGPSGSAGRADPVPAGRPGPRSAVDLAALRIDRAPVDQRRRDEPLAVRGVARPATLAQPGDARRRVARPALVVAVARRPDRRQRRERIGQGAGLGPVGDRCQPAERPRRVPGPPGRLPAPGGTFPTSGRLSLELPQISIVETEPVGGPQSALDAASRPAEPRPRPAGSVGSGATPGRHPPAARHVFSWPIPSTRPRSPRLAPPRRRL